MVFLILAKSDVRVRRKAATSNNDMYLLNAGRRSVFVEQIVKVILCWITVD
jgi:hypothetical protein